MATRYCADCGTAHECTSAAETELALARVWANRDIEVARINASAAKDIAETGAEHSSEHAEGVAEGMETALEAVAGGGEPEAAEGEPIVVDPGSEPDPVLEEEPENAPDVVEVSPPAESGRGGYWSMYN